MVTFLSCSYIFSIIPKAYEYNIICACMCSLALFSCDEVDDLLTFQVNDRTTIRIESSVPVALPFDVPTPDTF